jgi:hypothetical protein
MVVVWRVLGNDKRGINKNIQRSVESIAGSGIKCYMFQAVDKCMEQ